MAGGASMPGTSVLALVAQPMVNDAGDTAQVPVILATPPQSQQTADTLHRLRDEVIPQALEGSSAKAYVGGSTASYEDIASKIGQRMPLFLLYIVGVTFLILTMAFRSVVVATKAALTTLLVRAAAASFGALTAVFQWGMARRAGSGLTSPVRPSRSSRSWCSRSCSGCRWTTRSSWSPGSARSTCGPATRQAPFAVASAPSAR